jgi:hypothetical protein
MAYYQGDDCPGGHYPDISLSGYMRSGKDSIAKHLQGAFGYRTWGFARALKEEVAVAVGCDATDLEHEPLRTQIRPVLQVWGTEFRRAQDPNYWTKKVANWLNNREDDKHRRPIVFTDTRFLNEIDLLRGRGFVIVKVDMDRADVSVPLRQQGKTQEQIRDLLTHPSEIEWQQAEFDHTIPSKRGFLAPLYIAIDEIVRKETR